MKLFTIPNIITLANLLCGCFAIVLMFNHNLVWAAYLVGIAAVLDFLDGFVARALKQFSPIGKDLDSLADMVTFGVVPGIMMFQLMKQSIIFGMHGDNPPGEFLTISMAILPFFITLFSALRLAKFNNDTRQSDSFIGVPTPANSILICSFPLILFFLPGGESIQAAIKSMNYAQMNDAIASQGAIFHLLRNPYFLLGVTIIMSYLLISEIPLFALKFKSFKWKGNEIRYSFLAAAVVMLVLLKFIALPLIIVLYILLSVVNNLVKPKTS